MTMGSHARGGKAIILLGHGSRDPLWRRPIESVAVRLRQKHLLEVRCAYLELDQPDLAAAARQLAAAGALHITIVPMFLGAGKHTRDDLPRLLEGLQQDHPALRFDLQRPVGEDPRVLDLLAEIAIE